LVAVLVLGAFLVADWAYRAARWNLYADKVDALVERSHLAKWLQDPSSKPLGVDFVVQTTDAKIAPNAGKERA